MRLRALTSEAGMSLIESLVAMTILLVGVVSTLQVLDAASKTTVVNRSREGAVNLAREVTEAVRGVQYDRIETATLPAILQQQPGLGDADPASAGVYEVERRGFQFVVTTTSCIMDDPKDGGGNQSSGGYCTGSVAPNTPVDGRTDKNPEDYKRVTARVAWTHKGRNLQVTQDAIVNNPGAAGGPAVQTIGIVGQPSPPPVLTGNPVGGVTVQFTTTSRPATTNWLVDAAVQSPVPTAGTTGKDFTFKWDYTSLPDGTYVVGAEAFNKYGVSGPGKSMSVTLNRNPPAKPTELVGGRNRGIVELEWRANLEPDIASYEVQRSDGTVVCIGVTRPVCEDPSPPATGVLRYVVRAYDTDPVTSQPRSGPWSDTLDVPELGTAAGQNQPPNPITNAVRAGVDSPTLSWSRPSPDDPDASDYIRFYRIYRDSTGMSGRYTTFFEEGSAFTWTDGDPGTDPRRYWITAVDRHYLESDPIEVTP